MTSPSPPRDGRPSPGDAERRLGALVALAASSMLFAWLTRRVAIKAAEPFDAAARSWLRSHREPVLDAGVRPVTWLSTPGVAVAAALAGAFWLHRRGSDAGARALLVVPPLAATAGLGFTALLTQRNPPDAPAGGTDEVSAPSFPSGHTTGITAEALSAAWILAREGLGAPAVLATLIGWPLLVGSTRAYRDRHWATDVLGGWSAGTAVAAVGVLLYERWRAARLTDGETAG